MAYKSGNPALNKNTFANINPVTTGETMTLDGVVRKSVVMLILCVASGYFGWTMAAQQSPYVIPLLFGALIGALVVAIITIFKRTWSPMLAPLYAILEGFVLGAVSQLYESEFGGIVLQALLLTGGIFLAMLVAYSTHLIKPTENFKMGVAAATGGIALYYIAYLLFGAFGHQLPLVASNSGWGITFTVLVIIIAALNLVVDFDFIEQGVEKKAPKYMEWYASFGLFVTIVWLYLELLRLLAKMRSR